MPAFLAKLLSMIMPTILGWFYNLVSKRIEKQRAENAIEEKNKAVREQNEKAVTPEERKDAAKDIARNF
jgi:hypothetical protein